MSQKIIYNGMTDVILEIGDKVKFNDYRPNRVGIIIEVELWAKAEHSPEYNHCRLKVQMESSIITAPIDCFSPVLGESYKLFPDSYLKGV